MNFKFCNHIHTIDRNKFLLTISGKVAMGVLNSGTLEKFQGTHK